MNLLENKDLVAFLTLLKAGLWEKEAELSPSGSLDIGKVYDLAKQQACIGVISAGLEHMKSVAVAKEFTLTFASDALQLEQRNMAMNYFVGVLCDKMKAAGIRVSLVKGQGIAQCYQRPLWRACGDIDLLIGVSDYDRAYLFLKEISDRVGDESSRRTDRLHSEFIIKDWIVELHGTLHACLSNRMDRVIDDVQRLCFSKGEFRIWTNDSSKIYLPKPDNDVIFVFTHILQHLFLEGIGLRQICDLSRLLWTYRNEIDRELLYKRLKEMGVLSEWRVFGCLMVNTLGLPKETMPYYDKSYVRKSQRILSYVIETGNFGHNRDMSHLTNKNCFVKKMHISWNHFKDCIRLMWIFPVDAPRFFCRFMIDGVVATIK